MTKETCKVWVLCERELKGFFHPFYVYLILILVKWFMFRQSKKLPCVKQHRVLEGKVFGEQKAGVVRRLPSEARSLRNRRFPSYKSRPSVVFTSGK